MGRDGRDIGSDIATAVLYMLIVAMISMWLAIFP